MGKEGKKRFLNKRAQITIFIIIGILVVAGIGALVYVNNVKDKQENLPPEAASFKVYMDECLNNGLESGLNKIGYQGGYFNLDYGGVEFYSVTVPYYIKEKELLMPSKEQVVKELEDYVSAYMLICIGDYVDTETRIDESINPIIETSTVNDKVLMKITYPTTLISKTNSTVVVSNFKAEKQVRLEKVYQEAQKIVALQLADPYNICINCLDAIKDKDVTINGYTWEENTIVFMLRDYASYKEKVRQDDYEPYRFFFAIKYKDWSCDSLPDDIDQFIKDDCESQKATDEGGTA